MSRTWKLPSGGAVTRASNSADPIDPFRYELHTMSGPPVVLRRRDIEALAEIAGIKPRRLVPGDDVEESEDE